LNIKACIGVKYQGTEGAKTPEPSADYVIPFGKARMVIEAEASAVTSGESAVVVTYGMGVYWAQKAAKAFPGQISILDLRTLAPWDRAAGHGGSENTRPRARTY
jgi:2-oxoisovalerate dehydrogenase E1 component